MIRNRFLKDNFILMAGTVASGLLGYFFHFVVARKLSVGEYGELQAISSLSVFFGVLASALSYFIIKYSSVLASHADRGGQAHFIFFLTRKFRGPLFLVLIFYLLLLPLLKNLLHLGDYFGLVAIGFSVLFIILSAFYINSLQGWKKFFVIGAIGTTVAFSKLAAGYVLASFSATASAVSFSLLICAALGWLLAKYFSRREWGAVGRTAEKNNWRETYFQGESFRKSLASIFFFSLMLAAASNLDILLVKNLASAETAGYYAALSILGKIILWLNLAVVSVLLPDAFSLGHEGRPAHPKSVMGSYALIFCVSLPALLFYRLFSGFLVGLLFGGKYVIIAQSLWLFGLMALFLSLLSLEANLAMARRDFRATYLLGVAVAILATAVSLFHQNIQEIILSVAVSFSIGWVLILGLNLNHRFASKHSMLGAS